MRLRVVALIAAALVVGTASCGGDDDGPARPALDQIAPAVAALEAKLGGPQQYFEINATPQLVNLFVADAAKTSATTYLYVGGELAPPAAPLAAAGSTFAAAALTFDPATVLDNVADQLPGSDIVLFSAAVGAGRRGRLPGRRAVEGGRDPRGDAGPGRHGARRRPGQLKSLVSGMAGWRNTPLVPLTRS